MADSTENTGWNELKTVVIVSVLISSWFVVFTIGSQVPFQDQTSSIMKFLTAQTSNIIILGCIASMLGVLRRRIKNDSTDNPVPDYVSGLVSGFFTAMVALAFPGVLSNYKVNGASIFTPDQNTYIAFSLASSYISFISGYDKNVFDKLAQWVLRPFLGSEGQVDSGTRP